MDQISMCAGFIAGFCLSSLAFFCLTVCDEITYHVHLRRAMRITREEQNHEKKENLK